MAKAIDTAVQYILNELLKENKDLIQQIVYDAYSPVVYERTNEFKNDAWDVSTKKDNAGPNVKGEFEYYPKGMKTVDSVTGQHASVLTGKDMRDYLADIIYQGVTDSLFGDGPWTQPRNAFAELDKWMDSRKLRKLMETGMRKAGLSYEFHKFPTKR